MRTSSLDYLQFFPCRGGPVCPPFLQAPGPPHQSQPMASKSVGADLCVRPPSVAQAFLPVPAPHTGTPLPVRKRIPFFSHLLLNPCQEHSRRDFFSGPRALYSFVGADLRVRPPSVAQAFLPVPAPHAGAPLPVSKRIPFFSHFLLNPCNERPGRDFFLDQGLFIPL